SRNYSNEYNDIDLDSINKKHFENAKNIAYKNQQKSPVFLLSVPRSGTTLLENILDTQPDIITLSERSTIADTLEYLVTKLRKNYPQDLLSLSKSEIKKLQKVYYETANIFCESDDLLSPKSQQILIDKMPLNTLHIPLIITMFPDAKFIFPLRHPVDCVLSCFQQNFVFNSEMHFLSTLENVTKKYIDVMQHFKRCQKALTLDIHFIKYEQLTTNIERECHKIFDFLGMDNIDKNFLAFDLHAKNKIISTASVNQVNQKLYQSSVYKWKNYEKHLTKQMEELKPFIEQFGYRKLEEDLKN
ncbi:MAG: sulfotransferase, partial [Colwellia sp.]